MARAAMMRKGWFKIPGVQHGDRTLQEQLKGLGPLLDEVQGRHILELGCAEGLILAECMRRGAAQAWGIEVVPAAVEEAARQLSPYVAGVWQSDLDHVEIANFKRDADIVLMLAVLHKLQDPLRLVGSVLAANAPHGPDLIVLRTPARTPGYVQDPRSGMKRFDVGVQLCQSGYAVERVEQAHFGEWTGYFRRTP